MRVCRSWIACGRVRVVRVSVRGHTALYFFGLRKKSRAERLCLLGRRLAHATLQQLTWMNVQRANGDRAICFALRASLHNCATGLTHVQTTAPNECISRYGRDWVRQATDQPSNQEGGRMSGGACKRLRAPQTTYTSRSCHDRQETSLGVRLQQQIVIRRLVVRLVR